MPILVLVNYFINSNICSIDTFFIKILVLVYDYFINTMLAVNRYFIDTHISSR